MNAARRHPPLIDPEESPVAVRPDDRSIATHRPASWGREVRRLPGLYRGDRRDEDLLGSIGWDVRTRRLATWTPFA